MSRDINLVDWLLTTEPSLSQAILYTTMLKGIAPFFRLHRLCSFHVRGKSTFHLRISFRKAYLVIEVNKKNKGQHKAKVP